MLEGEPNGELEAQISPKQGQKVKTKSWYPTICSKKWSIALKRSNSFFRFDIFDIYLGNPAKHGEAESDLLSRILRRMFRDVDRRRGRVGANARAVVPA